MPKKNLVLLRKLRTRFLRMNPQHFHMPVIAVPTECGTAMCIAGHTLDLAGYKMRPAADPGVVYPAWILMVDFISPNGRVASDPLATARRLLGLTNRESAIFRDFDLKTPKQAAKRIEQLIAEG